MTCNNCNQNCQQGRRCPADAPLIRWLKHLRDRVMESREPDVIIGGHENPYLFRWHLIPRNRFLNVYLHLFLRSDDDRARHTHPWAFNLSVLIEGRYREWFGDGPIDYSDVDRGSIKFRWGAAPHRIELIDGPVWTIFVTGPRVRQWGFLCSQRFVHWKDFTSKDDPGSIGRGCD